MNSRCHFSFLDRPKIMSEMAKRVEERPFDIMDINMGMSGAEGCTQRRRLCTYEESEAGL